MMSMKKGVCQCTKGACSPTGQCPTSGTSTSGGFGRLYDDSTPVMDDEEDAGVETYAPFGFAFAGLFAVSGFVGLRMRRSSSRAAEATKTEDGFLAQEAPQE